MNAPIVAAVVLAAGGGRRYGMPKALVEYEGSLLVERAVRTARAVCDPVLVVLGAQAVDVWRQADLGGATVLANKDWETGMASSLRTGLDGLRGWPGRVDAALITLVDMPGMTPEALARVAEHAAPDALAVATYDGVRGHPVLIGRDHWAGRDRDGDRRRGRPPLPRRARRHRGRLHRPGRSDRPRRPAVRSTFGAVIARVVDEPLSVAEHEDAVADKAAGAVVSFAGVVRDHDGGRSVTELEYVGHPTARGRDPELADEFAARPDVHAVAVSHRIGLLGIGDVALACAVSAVAPRPGVRRLRRARRRGEEAAADLEAAGLHRRRGGVGRLPLSRAAVGVGGGGSMPGREQGAEHPGRHLHQRQVPGRRSAAWPGTRHRRGCRTARASGCTSGTPM